MAKLSKSSVNYSRGTPKAHCGLCKHYLGKGDCEIVAGVINPAMWCDHFSLRNAKESDMAKGKPPVKKPPVKKPGKGY